MFWETLVLLVQSSAVFSTALLFRRIAVSMIQFQKRLCNSHSVPRTRFKVALAIELHQAHLESLRFTYWRNPKGGVG
eukprot:scaffold8050_cov116-Cylindrotheca_fusiformis.AAC.7